MTEYLLAPFVQLQYNVLLGRAKSIQEKVCNENSDALLNFVYGLDLASSDSKDFSNGLLILNKIMNDKLFTYKQDLPAAVLEILKCLKCMVVMDINVAHGVSKIFSAAGGALNTVSEILGRKPTNQPVTQQTTTPQQQQTTIPQSQDDQHTDKSENIATWILKVNNNCNKVE